jgi:hypothetical protein
VPAGDFVRDPDAGYGLVGLLVLPGPFAMVNAVSGVAVFGAGAGSGNRQSAQATMVWFR